MLEYSIWLKGFKAIQINFDFEAPDSYIDMVFESIKDKTNNEMFLDACYKTIQQMNKQEWNKLYGYKGRPTVNDWVEAVVPKMIEKTIYEKCKITGANLVKRILVYPDCYIAFLNQNKAVKLDDSNTVNQKNIQTYINNITSKKI